MADLHFLPDSRFKPHLTIARAKTSRNAEQVQQAILAETDTEIGRVAAQQLVVVSSRLDADGPVYEVIGRAPFDQ